MNPTDVKTAEQLSFDGPIGLPLAFIISLLLLGVFIWSLRREQSILGPKTAIAFSVLRLLAVAAVMWMLLAPTNIITQTTSTRKAVVIMTDISASMSAVDPMGTAEELRWAIAGDVLPARGASDSSSLSPGSLILNTTEAADQAVAALRIAQRELLAAIAAIADYHSETQITQHALASEAALASAKSHLAAIQDRRLLTDDDAAQQEAQQLAEAVSSMLRSAEFSSFSELCQIFDARRVPSQPGWQESLSDLEPRIVSARNLTQELAHLLAQLETSVVSRQSPSQWTQLSQSSRIQRVADFLDNLQRSTLERLGHEVDVQWSRFDRSLSPMSGTSGARESLLLASDRSDRPKQSKSATNLSAALQQLQRLEQQQPIAAAFIFTDANHNDSSIQQAEDVPDTGLAKDQENIISDPAQVAANITDTPVYVVPIGNPHRLRDIAVVGVEAPSVAMRNDEIIIEAHLEAYQCADQRCVVQLLAGEEVIDFREVVIDSDFVSRTVRFVQRVPEIGEQRFQVAIEPIDGEVTDQNNLENVEVNVTRSDINILLADELPRWEFRYLAQLFRRDPKVQCDELLLRPRLIATGRREESQSLPVTADQWDQYDVVILGDLPPEHFSTSSQEALVEYLQQRGGTLVMIAGDHAMPQQYVGSPLEAILPVGPIDATVSDRVEPTDGYAFHVTDEGLRHVALMIGESQQTTRAAWDFVNRFSPLHKMSTWRKPKPTARNLIAAVPRHAMNADSGWQDSTFLCWQPIGRGRVVYLSGPDSYRLRFLRGDQLHYRFWGQLLRWAIAADLATGSKFVRVRSQKTRYQAEEPIHIETELYSDAGEPIVDAHDLELRVISGAEEHALAMTQDPDRPGVYTADFHLTKPGVYHAQPSGAIMSSLRQLGAEGAADVAFTVHADLPRELIDIRCNRVLANQISDLTGGQSLPPTAVSEVLALTDLTPVITEATQRKPLWDQWKYLWIVFGCLQIEWTIRKWRGLS